MLEKKSRPSKGLRERQTAIFSALSIPKHPRVAGPFFVLSGPGRQRQCDSLERERERAIEREREREIESGRERERVEERKSERAAATRRRANEKEAERERRRKRRRRLGKKTGKTLTTSTSPKTFFLKKNAPALTPCPPLTPLWSNGSI